MSFEDYLNEQFGESRKGISIKEDKASELDKDIKEIDDLVGKIKKIKDQDSPEAVKLSSQMLKMVIQTYTKYNLNDIINLKSESYQKNSEIVNESVNSLKKSIISIGSLVKNLKGMKDKKSADYKKKFTTFMNSFQDFSDKFSEKDFKQFLALENRVTSGRMIGESQDDYSADEYEAGSDALQSLREALESLKLADQASGGNYGDWKHFIYMVQEIISVDNGEAGLEPYLKSILNSISN